MATMSVFACADTSVTSEVQIIVRPLTYTLFHNSFSTNSKHTIKVYCLFCDFYEVNRRATSNGRHEC